MNASDLEHMKFNVCIENELLPFTSLRAVQYDGNEVDPNTNVSIVTDKELSSKQLLWHRSPTIVAIYQALLVEQ